MKPDPRWHDAPPEFWHYVRVLSEKLGYSRKRTVLVHTQDTISAGLKALELAEEPLLEADSTAVSMGDLVDYFAFRASLIEGEIRQNLQTADEARDLFEQIAERYTTGFQSLLSPAREENARLYDVREGVSTVVPYNKQKGVKRDMDFLTGTANILISHHLGGLEFDHDPRTLPAFTEDGVVVGSMSRRLDGAFPSTVNPVAMWEYKCYYYTTTFGSKISDAIYIADLDGYERANAEKATGMPINLTLFVDAYSTWMEQGKSYLCRMVDLLQRGAVDNLVVGREVVTAIPEVVPEWLASLEARETPRDFGSDSN